MLPQLLKRMHISKLLSNSREPENVKELSYKNYYCIHMLKERHSQHSPRLLKKNKNERMT